MPVRHRDHAARSVPGPRPAARAGLGGLHRHTCGGRFPAAHVSGPGLRLQRTDSRRSFQHFRARRRHWRGGAVRARRHQLPRRRKPAARRILRAGAVRHGGHGNPGRRQRIADRIRRPGNELDFELHPGRVPQARYKIQRIVAEIFYSGLVCHRVFPVRHRHGLRRHRNHPHRPGAAGARSDHQRNRSGARAFDPRARADFRRPRIQGGRRAVSHLWAGRIRRRADSGHGPARFGAQGRDLRPDASDFLRGVPRRSAFLVLGHLGLGHPDHVRRKSGGHRAVQREAHARVFFDRPCGIHPGRVRGGYGLRRLGRIVLSGGVYVHESRGLPGRHAPRPAG